MTQIKICGITSRQAVDLINCEKVDAVGFVFAPSRRRVTPEKAKLLKAKLRFGIQTVGVFAGMSVRDIAETAIITKVDVIQLHMDLKASDMMELLSMLPTTYRPNIWQRLPVPADAKTKDDVFVAAGHVFNLPNIDRYLLDTVIGQTDGGSGKTFPWAPARDLIREKGLSEDQVIIAGGLTPRNVADAVSFFSPGMVDVSSGVESDGQKDPNKVRAFIKAVASAGEAR